MPLDPCICLKALLFPLPNYMINAYLTEQRDFRKYFRENVENKPNPSPCEPRDISCLTRNGQAYQ